MPGNLKIQFRTWALLCSSPTLSVYGVIAIGAV